MLNPANAIKDNMWNHLKDGSQTSNPKALQESVYKLIQATTQKTGGQKNNGDISFKELDVIYRQIVLEATCLVLDPKFKEIFVKEEL